MDAFISHASRHKPQAQNVAAALEKGGMSAWVDRDNLRAGNLLRSGLHTALRESRVFVLLWSKQAAGSRWVAAELLTAFHLDRFIVPCILDAAPLPRFLRKIRHLDLRPRSRTSMTEVAREVAAAPDHANPLAPILRAPAQALYVESQIVGMLQMREISVLVREGPDAARIVHAEVEARIRALEQQWPLELDVLKVAGFHLKNAYMINHWAELQAGRPEPDVLLEQAEQKFFETLFVDPNEESALDGLASVLLLEGEVDAAAFFDMRAVLRAALLGNDYEAARTNLRMIAAHQPQLNVPPEYLADPKKRGCAAQARRSLEAGRRLLKRRKYAEAVAAFERALVWRPALKAAREDRGEALLRTEALAAVASQLPRGP
jgi:hypothetical protein